MITLNKGSSQWSGQLFGVFLLAVVVLEMLYVTNRRSVRITYTVPLVIVMSFYMPFYLLYVVTIAQFIVRAVRNKYVDYESSKLLDWVWFSQLLTYLLLDNIVIFINIKPLMLINSGLIFDILIMVSIYCILEYLLIFSELSLRLKKNVFLEMRWGTFISNILSYTVITALEIFTYENNGVVGILLVTFLVVQLSGNFYLSFLYKEFGNKLIYDSMTKAYNRNYFEEVIQTKVFRKQPFAILFIDLDDFKKVNDNYGHLLGDALLVDFVAIMNSILRKENKLFRYGGDEFCVIFNDEQQAIGAKQRIENYTFVYQAGEDINISYDISLGYLNYCGEDSVDIESLLHKVDQNMYADKKKKKCFELTCQQL